jgi:hypothetical protein
MVQGNSDVPRVVHTRSCSLGRRHGGEPSTTCTPTRPRPPASARDCRHHPSRPFFRGHGLMTGPEPVRAVRSCQPAGENAPRSLATDDAAAWDTVQHSRGHRRRPRRQRLRAAQVHHQLGQRAHCRGLCNAARVGLTVGSLGQGLPDCVGIALAAGTSTGATPRGTCPLGPDLYVEPASNLTASCSTTCSSTRLGTFRRMSLRNLWS